MRSSHKIAQRMAKLDASGIRKVFDLAATMTDPISLAIGQPDFDVPDELKEEAIRAIREGCNKYTQTQGTAELLNAVAQGCCREFGWDDPYHGAVFGDRGYLVTSGVSGALLLAMLCLVDPGDEVVFPDPYFVMYSHLANLAGGVPVPVETYPDFRPTAERIASAVTDCTRLLILNSPSNPTGAVYTERELKDIAEIAARRDLLIISDEIYRDFCYDRPFLSIASYYDNVLIMRGFSKSHAMTGWRVGWCTGPKALIDKMTMLQQYSFVCAPSMAQVAAAKAIGVDMSSEQAAYRRKRDMVVDALSPKFDLVRPEGAFYAFVPAPDGDAGAFVREAISANVLIIPGEVFSGANTHFRVSYATSDEKLARGLEILAELA